MAIKKLQNDFTTPEQSIKLLELGVPADSADCIWYNPYYDGTVTRLAEISVWKGKYPQRIDKYTLPCWSVGRLIEIWNICLPEKPYPCYPRFGRYENMIHIMVDAFVFAQGDLDFSKLED